MKQLQAAAAGTPALDPHLRISVFHAKPGLCMTTYATVAIDSFIVITWMSMTASINPTQPTTPDPLVATADGRGLLVPCAPCRRQAVVYRYSVVRVRLCPALAGSARSPGCEGQRPPLRVLPSVDSAFNWDEGTAIPRPPVERQGPAERTRAFFFFSGSGRRGGEVCYPVQSPVPSPW